MKCNVTSGVTGDLMGPGQARAAQDVVQFIFNGIAQPAHKKNRFLTCALMSSGAAVPLDLYGQLEPF